MIKCTCDETKPYIFISYAHKDSKKVIPIVDRLIKEGYNVWYDEGIDPGTEWDENIAKHINECSYFVAFVTSAYIDSKNCKDELNFSRDLDKEQLLVYLEEVDLPMGMAMRMNRLQAIWWDKYSNNNYEDAYAKLFAANGISKMKNQEVAEEVKVSENSLDKKDDLTQANTEKARESVENIANTGKPKKKNVVLKVFLILIPIFLVFLIIFMCTLGSIFARIGRKSKKVSEGYKYLHTNTGKEYSPADAYDCFEKEAVKNDENAYFMLGYIYGNSLRFTVDEDFDMAISYYDYCEPDNYYAILAKGIAYYDKGMNAKGEELVKNALSNIDEVALVKKDEPFIAEVYYLLGRAYSEGIGCEEDDSKAFIYFNNSIQYGSYEAYYSEILEYAKTIDDESSKETVKSYIDFLETSCYYKGYLVEGIVKEALYDSTKEDTYARSMFSAYLLAGASGVYLGYDKLAELYISDEKSEWYDVDKAISYYIMAAETGDEKAYLELAKIYTKSYEGRTDMPDFDKADSYLTTAINNNVPESFFFKGEMCEIAGNKIEAYEWYSKGAELEESNCLFALGVYYFSGLGGCEQDYEKAVEYFQVSMECGNNLGYAFLANAYYGGKGVEQDVNKAMLYYEEGAKKGNVQCMIMLASIYVAGDSKTGIVRDTEKSRYWYNLANSEEYLSDEDKRQLKLIYTELETN